jgi:5-formyltetrahydrofolate cyclo-ligase
MIVPEPKPRPALRREARAARAAFVAQIAPAVRQGLEAALARRLRPLLEAPAVLGSYAAIGDEIDPAAIEAVATGRGWRLAFPRVVEDGLVFHAAAFAALAPGYRGIPEPPAGAPPLTPSLLLVPLLAADRAGNRLGQGGGHYDRTLAALRAAGSPVAVGLAFDVQLVAALAPEPWDQPLDSVATPTAFHAVAAVARAPA